MTNTPDIQDLDADFFDEMMGIPNISKLPLDLPTILPPDRQAVYDDLIVGLIGWEVAAKRLEALQPVWHTKEWKANRVKVLKTFCEQCGQTEGIMVIQHHYHPPSITDIIKRLAGKTEPEIQPFIDNARKQLVEQYALIQPERRESCPKCGSVSIRWHKTDKVWKCMSYTGHSWNRRSECKNIFTEPSYVQDLSPASKKAISVINDAAYQTARKAHWEVKLEWWADISSRHGNDAVIESLRWSSWYLSLEGAKTFCKKCAFIADKHIITVVQN